MTKWLAHSSALISFAFICMSCTQKTEPQVNDSTSPPEKATPAIAKTGKANTKATPPEAVGTRDRTIIFGIVPQQAPSKIIKNWQPFASEMSKRTGYQWVIKTAPSIPEFEKRCLDGRYDIAYMNPYHYTVFAQKPGYRAFARQKDKRIKGILVVKKDVPITSLAELAGKRATFPSPAAFAASVVTRTYLRNEKIDIQVNYSNSHDSVYRNVAKKIQDVGGGVMRTWKATPDEIRAQLRILWTSPPYTPHAFAYHPRLGKAFVDILESTTRQINSETRLANIFDPIRFKGLMPAKDQDWNDVRALKITELSHLLK